MRQITAFVLLFSALITAAWSAGAIRPGLWEMTMKSDAMKNLPKLAPEQLDQMRKMGIEVPQMQDGAMVTKVCISKEMAQREEPPMAAQNQMGCQPKNYQRNGSGYSVDIVCDGPMLKGTGKGSFSGDQAFTSTYDFNGTAQGQPVKQHHETSGKWLAANCGGVKPLDEMMPKK